MSLRRLCYEICLHIILIQQAFIGLFSIQDTLDVLTLGSEIS